jgi:hypothetical protein
MSAAVALAASVVVVGLAIIIMRVGDFSAWPGWSRTYRRMILDMPLILATMEHEVFGIFPGFVLLQ